MVGFHSLRAVLAAGVAAAALMASGADAADLALKRVLLSTGGVGLYEYEAEVEGDATIELKAPLDQIDDILKSLVVFDDAGGIGGLDLASAEPLTETFKALPFTAADLQSTPRLLTALRGAEVEVGGDRVIKGRIVAVSEEAETRPDGVVTAPRHRVTVMSDDGLEQFVLEHAASVRFVDADVRADVAKALRAVAADAERGQRTLRLISKGAAKRTLRVAYLAAAAVWKTSYRLVLDADPDAKRARLQGWATLENLSGQDWSGVDLTLVSGRPVAYRQALYRAYMVDRPQAPVELGAKLDPGVDRGAIRRTARAGLADAENAPKAMAAPAPMALARVQAQSPAMSAGAAEITAEEGETQVSFHLPFPVTVASGRTLSLPIVDTEAPVERIALYDPLVDARHPLSAAELRNDGKAALPPGIVTIYENADAGTTYVGDSRLGGAPAGETRLLSFALDQKTTIEEDESDNDTLSRARLAKGVLTIDDLTRRRTILHVKAAAPRQLVALVQKLDGGKLTEPASGKASEAEGRYRVPFDIKAGEQTFAVTQERTQTRLVALADLDDAGLSVYARSGAVDEETRATLQKLAALRGAEAEAERSLSDVQNKIDAVVADQTRLKDLLGAVAGGSDLSKRYLRALDADETELQSLRASQVQRQRAREEARKAVEAFVSQP